MSSKKGTFVPMYCEKMLRSMSLIVKSTIICVKFVVYKCLSAMIAKVLIENYWNSSAINVCMVVYVMIICKTTIYIWNIVVKMMDMIICKTAICILACWPR
jgi:hypothetical protein